MRYIPKHHVLAKLHVSFDLLAECYMCKNLQGAQDINHMSLVDQIVSLVLPRCGFLQNCLTTGLHYSNFSFVIIIDSSVAQAILSVEISV